MGLHRKEPLSMGRLHLHIGEALQGKFDLQKLNLLLIFQVNCPGCFIYALPMFAELHKRYSGELGFLAMSTAFEDFALNTASNTQLFLKDGELTGEVRKAAKAVYLNSLDFEIDFPVAMDAKMESAQKETIINNICSSNPNFKNWPSQNKDLMKQRVSSYLNLQEEVFMTFTSNQFRGTPTFVLFNDKYELIDSWFGHSSTDTISTRIDSEIN